MGFARSTCGIQLQIFLLQSLGLGSSDRRRSDWFLDLFLFGDGVADEERDPFGSRQEFPSAIYFAGKTFLQLGWSGLRVAYPQNFDAQIVWRGRILRVS
jgi:hypothetical protein